MVLRLLGDQRIRFLLVGGFNTALGYGLFVAFELTIGQHIGYLVSLYGSTLLATIVAFFLHRHFTYKIVGKGHMVRDFLRFETVYIASLLINTAALPLLVEIFGVPVLISQALIVVITTTVSYFGHKFLSFRRSTSEPPSS